MGETGHLTCWSWGSGKSSQSCGPAPVSRHCCEGCRVLSITRVPSQTRASYGAHWWHLPPGLVSFNVPKLTTISLRVWNGRTEVFSLLLSTPRCFRHHVVKQEPNIFSPPLNSKPMSLGSVRGCKGWARSRQDREPLWSRSCRHPLRDEGTRIPSSTCKDMKAYASSFTKQIHKASTMCQA